MKAIPSSSWRRTVRALCLAAAFLFPATAFGQLFVVDNSGGIAQFDDSGNSLGSFAPQVGAQCIALSGSDLFVANFNAGTIGEYTTSGQTVNGDLVNGLNKPLGIAVWGDKIFGTNAGNGTVGEYTTSGGMVNPSLISGLDTPFGIATDGTSLYVVTQFTGSSASGDEGLVQAFDMNGNGGSALFSPSPTLVNPSGIAVANGDLFVSALNAPLGQSVVEEYTTDGTALSTSLVAGLQDPIGLAVAGNDLFVVSAGDPRFFDDGTIGEYTTTGIPLYPNLITSLNTPEGIAVAVPEPASMALLLLTFCCCAVDRRLLRR